MKKQYNFSQGKRGTVIPPDSNKTRITIRLDKKIVDYFKEQVHQAGGGNYQTLMNNVLLEHIENRQDILENTLRKVIREELSSVR